ncbi:hypothetical protein IW261DRAFT_1572500 [Armillaria novae-zelandiae]|uniref:Uncharacterized protein n=1 Tax=Armillaria novae-zelandiae TaxID=153914 RepID=A0AA39NSF2_9AGAR|nr:hypothetical protein IW261DRAFT_1572500 [Armillaria novae-zelandiae]
MVGLLVISAATAILHHIYLSFLRNRDVKQQFWIKNSSNALSTSIQWLCAASLSLSLTQVTWSLIRRRPFTLIQLNHLFGLPNPYPIIGLTLSIGSKSWGIIPVIVMAAAVQAFTLVSILAPNSLAVGSASPRNDVLDVPAIFFNTSKEGSGWTTGFGGLEDCTVSTSSAWKRIFGRAFQSDNLITWNPPEGCQSGCNYTIEYPAPALLCSDISEDEILGNGDAVQTSDPSQPTVQLSSPSFLIAESVYSANYFLNHNGASIALAWRIQDIPGAEKVVGGARCSLYNTTQKAVVSFSNGTVTILPSIVSYHEPFGHFGDTTCNKLSGDAADTPVLAYYTSYYAVTEWLFQQLGGNIVFFHEGVLGGSNVSTGIVTSNLFMLNEHATLFSSTTRDIKGGLEQMLVNFTVALMASSTDKVAVQASVSQNQLVWEYDAQNLWTIYGIALAFTAVSTMVGLACIWKDGDNESFSFLDILRATRNSKLDDLFATGKDGNTRNYSVLQYGESKGYSPNIDRVFRPVAKSDTSSWIDLK